MEEAKIPVVNCNDGKVYSSKLGYHPYNVCIPSKGGEVQTPRIKVVKKENNLCAECQAIRCVFNSGVERS